MSSFLPLQVWATLGKSAWRSGRIAIQLQEFIFVQTAEDIAYAELKRYAIEQAHKSLDLLENRYSLTPTQYAHLIRMYVHAYVNGALDELILQGQQHPK